MFMCLIPDIVSFRKGDIFIVTWDILFLKDLLFGHAFLENDNACFIYSSLVCFENMWSCFMLITCSKFSKQIRLNNITLFFHYTLKIQTEKVNLNVFSSLNVGSCPIPSISIHCLQQLGECGNSQWWSKHVPHKYPICARVKVQSIKSKHAW